MTYDVTLTTEAEMDAMAGENIDLTGWTEANKNLWGFQAESYLSCVARYNFTDNYATLNIDIKKLLNEYVARYAAMSGIAYNMGGFTSRIEGEDMLNIHVFRMRQIERLLLDQKTDTYIQGA